VEKNEKKLNRTDAEIMLRKTPQNECVIIERTSGYIKGQIGKFERGFGIFSVYPKVAEMD